MVKTYIYQASLLCEEHGSLERERLRKAGSAPKEADIADGLFDSDEFPAGPYEDGGGESDTPNHCDLCGLFLKNPLTADGYAYVAEAICDFVEGEGDSEVILEWAEFYGFRKAHVADAEFDLIRLIRRLREWPPPPS